MANFKAWVETTRAGNYLVRHQTDGGPKRTDYHIEKMDSSILDGKKLVGKNLANALSERVKQRYYQGELGECDLTEPLEPLIEKYISHCEGQGLTWMTTAHYETVLRKFAEESQMMTLADLTDARVRAWRNSALIRLKNSTVVGRVVIILVFCRWLIKHEHLKAWPFKDDMIPTVKRPTPKFYTLEEWKALDAALAEIDPMARLACNLAYYAGLRKIELVGDDHGRFGVEWEDLTWLPDGEVELMVRKELAKGGKKARSVLLDPDVVSLLGSRKSGPLLTISRRNLWYAFERARRKSGISPRLTIHGLRHSFAKNYLQDGGMSLSAAKDALGHEDIKTTQIYSAHEKSHLASGIRKAYETRKIKESLIRRDGRKDMVFNELNGLDRTKSDDSALQSSK